MLTSRSRCTRPFQSCAAAANCWRAPAPLLTREWKKAIIKCTVSGKVKIGCN
uniref:Uncharacterized protein n=1 Tax=Zea mays TaxID=4577 RepID=B6T5G9_MAIZE|nr:hypothetical protein [Zea mays]